MRARQFILREYSRDITAQKLGPALLQKFRKEPQQWQWRITGAATDYDDQALDYLLARVELADPTKNKQYVPWLIRSYVNAPSLKFEDLITKFTEPLTKFYKLVQKKQIPAPSNDIGRIKDLATLVQLVDQYPDVEDKVTMPKGQAKSYYEDADIRVIIPEDQTAACYYGQGTKWCTAARDNNMFDRYNKAGEMYIIIPKKPAYAGEKYQFHFQSKQFMNEKDQRINLTDLRTRFPQLADIFAKQAADNGIISLDKTMDSLHSRMNEVLPIFRETLRTMIRREGTRVAREIAHELGAVNKYFKGMDEVWELAEIMMEEDAPRVALNVMNAMADNGVEIANDEDQLYDIVTDFVADMRSKAELWLYITEILEEMEDEEGEFDCAMAIDGEVSSLIIKLTPEAFKESLNALKRSA